MSRLTFCKLTFDLEVISKWELDLIQCFFNIIGYGAEVASFYVGGYIYLARLTFALDHIRNGNDANVSDICQTLGQQSGLSVQMLDGNALLTNFPEFESADALVLGALLLRMKIFQAVKLGEAFSEIKGRESEISAVVESMAEGVVAFDAEGRVRVVNPVAMGGREGS